MMKEILLKQKETYPAMEIRDAVKLLYQSEFGGGHLIADSKSSLKRLKEEGEGLGCEAKAFPMWEEIGDGVCRIYLSVLHEGLLPETLNQMFVLSAERIKGTREGFEKKLDILLECCERGELLFSPEAVRQYLNGYREQGYPAVSHSESYRQQYHPAYRIVQKEYVEYYQAFLQIDCKLASLDSVLVAIDGQSGSGKSTLGRLLQQVYHCRLFHTDDFFLRPEQRTQSRLSEIGGNVDYERFQTEILNHIEDREGLEYRPYDCSTQRLGAIVTAPWQRLNIVEGAYSQHPYFGDIYDLRFFCGIEKEEQICRIRERNGEYMLGRFLQEWIPMENRYLEQYQIKDRSIKLPSLD